MHSDIVKQKLRDISHLNTMVTLYSTLRYTCITSSQIFHGQPLPLCLTTIFLYFSATVQTATFRMLSQPQAISQLIRRSHIHCTIISFLSSLAMSTVMAQVSLSYMPRKLYTLLVRNGKSSLNFFQPQFQPQCSLQHIY